MGIFKKIFKSEDLPAPAVKQSVAPEKSDAKLSVAPRLKVDQLLPQVLLYPIITEKASTLQTMNQYVFAVQHEANKIVVARAVENEYGIKPVAVRVSWVAGKERVRGRRKGRTAPWKKAVVTLPKGKSISINEGV